MIFLRFLFAQNEKVVYNNVAYDTTIMPFGIMQSITVEFFLVAFATVKE